MCGLNEMASICYLCVWDIWNDALQNSNLVLQADRDARRAREPTGEPESLRGRDLAKMGDRIPASRPKDLDEKIQRMRAK